MPYYYRRRSMESILFGRWAPACYPATVIAVGAILVRRKLLRNADFLGGYSEIMRFFKVNSTCFAVCILTFIAEAVLCGVFCVNKQNSARKIGAFIWGIFVSAVCSAILGVFTYNVYADTKGTTHARPETYVLCVKGSEHYLAFKDRQEYALMPINETTYEALEKGTEAKEDEHKDIYSIVVNNGYSDVTEYTSAASIDYYFNCAMIEKAELLF